MKKFNSAVITLAAVMSMSASAMAAPLCTNTLSNSLQSCKLSTSVLACNSASANCDINSLINSNCTSNVKGKMQYFTSLSYKSKGAIKTNLNGSTENGTTCTGTTCANTAGKDATCTGTTCANTAGKDATCTGTTCANTVGKDATCTGTTCNTTASKPIAPKTTAPKTATPSNPSQKATTQTPSNPTKTNTNVTNTTNNSSVSSYAQEVVNLVNAERAKEGLSPLSIDSKVTAAAQVRATEIKTSFSHTRPDGRSCFTALAEAGASYSGAGENIAIGQKTPSEVVTAWMNSPGHRANIMKPNFKYIGVGVNGTAWAQLFTY
ncbi:MAG: CAP domain-containing protein [Lachnospiraceae bacterium]|nr:CAP domain-containing protein [Lachnospiraceae bacterium]